MRSGSNGERRREELADFLRTKRASLQPEDVGLPDGGRRRTPGLRREEVALLAGVGATWYTWLEQGRDVRASLEVLEAVSRALRLTPAERAHVILLGRGEQAPPCKAPAEEVSPTLRRLVENLGPGPAYLLGRRWDYLAWNKSFERVFGWEPGSEPLSRNHVWLWFMDPTRRTLCRGDWSTSARLLVAKFRADSARNIGDPAFEELISALSSSSPEFRKLWKRHEVAGSGLGHKELNHPLVGPLAFDHAVFNHGDAGEQRLILYSPACEYDTHAKLARLLEADAQASESAVALA
ncbi:MAG: helix-turn-helix domain-containing protein [Solirubrobacterales bacterium]|nr:helix-turn-helix domain-containing protein [Solirubrobacterales bacterium]MBV8947336.1 helix-turn-helix domain-containing protein [Solirubrobacterales bacterium]MBV9364196.1 helix-turn-helix domain-containing protein [Solirubrobacterales bacterium]MBV9680577.1 helix-turn-helix domain-containing protein [Solirubrobacterales bacterium]MBV9807340.1 helix-turn-helix domain-containing protein [Solirubrobacterales bacterium]